MIHWSHFYCFYLPVWLVWMSFRGWKCDEHPRHPSMQRIPAWCCVCLLPISSENRLCKEVIRPSDKTKWHWKEKSLGTIRRLISAFKCRCFPNERQLHPCYASHFLTVLRTTLYISPRTLQDYRDRKIIPYTQFAGKILYKASDLARILEENYKGRSSLWTTVQANRGFCK